MLGVQRRLKFFYARCRELTFPLQQIRAAWYLFQPLDLLSKFAHHLSSIGIYVSDQKKPRAETFRSQPLLNDSQGGLLLANDKHALLEADAISNNVDDRLTFTCTRRALDKKSRSSPGRE